MFVVDLLTAVLLATVLTILLAGIVRDGQDPRWRNLPIVIRLLVVASWGMGIILVTSEAWIGHWVPFVLSTILLFVVAFNVIRRMTRREASSSSGNKYRMAIILYFTLTLLLFFCAISVRFYFENFG